MIFYSFYLLININPVITRKAAKRKSGVITSLKINHPKKIVNIGVKKEKLATPEAGYFDNNHNQNTKSSEDAFHGYLPIVSVQNEIAAWKLISDTVDESLAKYPTTLDQDFELLKQNPSVLTPNQRNCIKFR